MGETREVGKPAQREQTREQSVPKNELRRMGENFDWKKTLPLKLSSEHTYKFQTKSVQAFRSSLLGAEPRAETFQKNASNLLFSLF